MRRDAGMFDVSHMLVVDVEGNEADRFLRWLLANDVARLKAPGKALYSCMLNETAGVLDDLIVYYLGPQQFRLVVNAGTADKDLAWIAAQRDRLAPSCRLRRATRSGDDRAAGAACARAILAGATGSASRNRRTGCIPGCGRGRYVRRPHRIYGRRWLRGHAACRSGRFFVARSDRHGRRCVWTGRARHAAAGSRDESIWPGHGRIGHADGVGSRLDGGLVSRTRLHRPRGAGGHARRAPRKWVLVLLERACCGAIRPCERRTANGMTTSGSFSPTLGLLDRARPRAAGGGRRRAGSRCSPREVACGQGSKIPVRPQRQELAGPVSP